MYSTTGIARVCCFNSETRDNRIVARNAIENILERNLGPFAACLAAENLGLGLSGESRGPPPANAGRLAMLVAPKSAELFVNPQRITNRRLPCTD
jgi:hypothetical protein